MNWSGVLYDGFPCSMKMPAKVILEGRGSQCLTHTSKILAPAQRLLLFWFKKANDDRLRK